MLIVILTALVCGLAYAIKGGSMNLVFKNWNAIRNSNKVLDAVLDGKVLSTVIILLYSLCFVEPLEASILAGAWLLSVAMSMGEEQAAVGDYSGGSGPYLDKGFGRTFGVKKAIQRGLVYGVAFTLATQAIIFLPLCLLYVPCVWIGQSLNLLILKHKGWEIAEPIIGAIVIGIGLGLHFNA